MAALIFLAFLVVLGVAVVLGRTPDTRDPEFSLGRVLAPRTASGGEGR
jgi:hypothetical protein